ncbi:hypothetical protein BC938DRAFT_475240, partial [Jimgerdemannia flammicorona]
CDTFEVQEIIGRRTRNGTLQYRVRWVGFPGQDTWKPASNLSNAQEINKLNKIKDIFEVQEIIGKRIRNGTLQYRVRWIGFSGQDTWEPTSNLGNTREAVNCYEDIMKE